MADYKNIPLGLRTQTQIPLDVKEYIQNELLLSNLGVNGQLAYTYTKGLVVYCIEESTRWEWREVESGLEDTGLINQDFIYSDNHIAFGIDYSNKSFNFFQYGQPINQNNIVKNVIILKSDLPEAYSDFDVLNYFLTLPEGDRTLSEINSKLNIIVGEEGEGFYTAQIFEIQNQGKGVIETLDISDFVKLRDADKETPSWQEVLVNGTELTSSHECTLSGELFNLSAYDDNGSSGGYFGIAQSSLADYPDVFIGRRVGNNDLEKAALEFNDTSTIFIDNVNNRGIENAGDYEANFTARSLITKQYVDNKIFENKQKVITSNYLITNADDQYTIFINNGATPITITIDSTVTISNFCVGFIQKGTADITFVGTGVTLTNPIGLKSKGQGYQTFIERELSTSSFFLLGNTKP